MSMLLSALMVVAIAAIVLVALLLLLTVQRLMRLRWKAISSQTVARQDVPEASRAILAQASPELTKLGFIYRTSGSSQKAIVTPEDSPAYFDLYQHRDGHTFAMVSPHPGRDYHQPFVVQLITCLSDGNNLVTVNRFQHFSPMTVPHWQVFDDYLPDWKLAWQKHLARVQSLKTQISVDSSEANRRLHESAEQLIPQMATQRQLLPVAAGNHYRLAPLAALRFAMIATIGQWRSAWATRGMHGKPVPPDPANENPSSAALAESVDEDVRAFREQLALRESAKGSARSKILVFVITALLFVAVGGFWSTWSFAATLLAVVAIHEGGHYFAMRLTGYRNVSVFFLPGLGGIATGEKVSATPFEKLFVYLAGPVPGVAIACIAYWGSLAGYWMSPPWLNEFLIASLLINYFNLLPIVPLDGGRVMDIFVFSHMPRLRFGFAVACCGLLFGLGMMLNEMVLRVVAVLLAFGLPYQWRKMRLALAMESVPTQALAEQHALQLMFKTMRGISFRDWSFARRAGAAGALLPDFMGRRVNFREALAGTAIYAALLAGPIAGAYLTVPQLGFVTSLFLPGLIPLPGMVADDVDPAPVHRAATPVPDWDAKLVNASGLSKDELLQAYLGAGRQASDSEDTGKARRNYLAAWELAQAVPARDWRRIEALEGLASVAERDSDRAGYLHQIVSELAQPEGPERLRVARAKEHLAYSETTAAGRIKLLRDALALRRAVNAPDDYQIQLTQRSLAQALSENSEFADAEAMLRQRIDSVAQPAANDRTREALERRVQRVLGRVDLAWYLIAQRRAEEARSLAIQSLAEVPDKVTVSWVMPKQQILEVTLWAAISSRQTASLNAAWNAYEKARGSSVGAGGPLLFHEADRAVVATMLADAKMLSAAKAGIQKAMSRKSQAPMVFCNLPAKIARSNWREVQQTARRQVLTELGVCSPLPE